MRSYSQATRTPRFSHVPCITEFHVNISGNEDFFTAVRRKSFVTGKTFTVTPPDESDGCGGQGSFVDLAAVRLPFVAFELQFTLRHVTSSHQVTNCVTDVAIALPCS